MTDQRVYKITEVAKILRCTRQTVETLIAQGKMPCIKVTPKLYRITQDGLDAFLSSKSNG